jgi:hypothetical protein
LNIKFSNFDESDSFDTVAAVASIALTFGLMAAGLFLTRVATKMSCFRTMLAHSRKDNVDVFALKDPEQVNRMTMTRIHVTAPESFSRAGYRLAELTTQSESPLVRTRLPSPRVFLHPAASNEARVS